MRRIATEVKALLPAYSTRNYYCVILAGICSLTEKIYENHQQSIRYPLDRRHQKIEDVTNIIHDLKNSFGKRINISTIVPASLGKYFQHHNPNERHPPELEAEQDALLEDIERLNQVIRELNFNFGTTTINLSNRFLTHSKKKQRRTNSGASRRVTKFKDQHLSDGVHFSEEIKSVCFTLIYSTAELDLSQLSQDNIRCEDSSQDSQDSETEWDFKRKVLLK